MLDLLKKVHRKVVKDKSYPKVRDHCHYSGKYRGTAYCICNLRFNMSIFFGTRYSIFNLRFNVPVFFHTRSNYNYHKKISNQVERKFKCLGENTGKYQTFSIPIVKDI